MSEKVSQTTPAPPVASHRVLSKFAHLLGAQWFRDFMNTIFMISLARMSAQVYGEFSLAFELGALVAFVAEFGMNQALVADLGKKSSPVGDVLARYTLLKALLSGLGWAGGVGFVYWQEYQPDLRWLALCISAGMALEGLASTFFVACRTRGRQDLEARVRMTASLLGYGYGLAALFLGAPFVVVGLFKAVEHLVNLGGGMYMALGPAKVGRLRLGPKPLARTWRTAKNGMVFLLIALAGILYNKANIFFLQRYGGAPSVAQYSIAWVTVDGAAAMVSNILLRNVLYPLFVDLWHNDRDEFMSMTRTAVRWLLAVALPVMFLLCVEADRIVTLVYGPTYQDSIWMQQLLVPVILCGFFHNTAAYIMMSRKEERLLLIMYLVGLASNLVFCVTLIPTQPLLGTVLSIVFTRVVMTCCTMGYCQYKLRLVQWNATRPVVLAAALGGGLYWLVGKTGIRELAELAALGPILWLGWRWWRALRGAKLAA